MSKFFHGNTSPDPYYFERGFFVALGAGRGVGIESDLNLYTSAIRYFCKQSCIQRCIVYIYMYILELLKFEYKN